jgi:hypothetical protein
VVCQEAQLARGAAGGLLLSGSVADPHRKKNPDADPGKNLNADAVPDADSCPY